MRGRDEELRIASEILDHAERGQGKVLLIEGDPGVGKTGLLDEVLNEAGRRHFSLAKAEADEIGRRTPFAPLLTALQDAVSGLPGETSALSAPESWAPVVGQFRALLERRAAASPLLVSLDDLHYADPATLYALRHLTRQLATHRLAWSLARSTVLQRDHASVLFDLLAREGGARVTLGPLDDEAIAGTIADILGAVPDPGLRQLAAGAAGNPFLLTELVLGLMEEHAVKVEGGTAVLIASPLPRRLRDATGRCLARLSQGTGRMLETAAVLGLEFRLDDVAQILGETPVAMIPPVNEAIAAGIVRPGTDSFVFRHDLMRRAVAEAMPAPTRQLLHRQAGEVFVARGSAKNAAAHLLKGARHPDPAVMASLKAAATQLARSHPQAAADLLLRVLDLTPATDDGRFSGTVRAADALTAAARLDDATALVRTALARPQPPEADTRLRVVLSSILVLQGTPRDAMDETEAVLRQPDLTAETRAGIFVTQLQALSGLGENARAFSLAEDIRTASRELGDPAQAAALQVAAAINWDEGRLERGLRLISEAVRRARGISPDVRDYQPLLALAAMLIDVRRLEEAEGVILAASENMREFRPSALESVPAVLRARVELARGRTASAHAEAEKALTIADTFGVPPHGSLAHSLLSVIALRKGDLRAAGLHIRSRPDVAHYITGHAWTESLLARARFIEASVGAETALQVLDGVYTDLPLRRHVLVGEPTASAWLARTALAAGRGELATGVARVADELARDNPGFDAMTVAAAHCGGIVGQDPELLAHAAASHRDPWARASAAEDLGTVLIAINDPDGAVECLDAALGGYGHASAERDLARIRRRLRKLGVRRQHRATGGRPATGWESLTEIEQMTATLVAEGLTNHQVADRMYVSAHTVAFHLKQVFRKLGIGSRVELARIVAAYLSADGQGRERGRGRARG
ncbi:MAG TPA: AAA family ATPase [Trebonia sp.]|nr:AAA family ATPase [Trebonia sp.]